MATSIQESWENFRYQDTADQITVEREYTLTIANVGDTVDKTVLPDIDDADANWTSAKVVSREIRSVSDTVFKAKVVFQSRIGDGGINPTTLPTQWSWSFGTEAVKLNSDRDGNIIMNSAGVPYDNLTGSIPLITFTGTKYVSSLDLATWASTVDKVNDATWNPSSGLFQIGARKAKCLSINPVGTFDNGNTYYQVQYSFGVKSAATQSPEGWKLRTVDEGKTYYSDGAGTKLVTATDTDGLTTYGTVLLNGYGRKKGQSGGPGTPQGATRRDINGYIYLEWDIKEESDFDALGL